MKKKEYKYDAFISYRHCDLDKFVAENLHRLLESYELPKEIKEKLKIEGRTIRRVFRDQEELPLSSNLEDPILDALNDSKYLIVICSPRLKDSLWCKKEIETFKKLRGRRNIFCVLVEGEPKDSFPKAVLYDDDNKTLVEPLAADVRGETKKEVLKKLKNEKLRLIAPMHHLDYDDLKQRHKMQEQRRMVITSSIVAVSCLLFALYTSIMLIKINNQQKLLKMHQAISLSEKSTRSLKKDSRYNAVKYAYQALTKFNGVKMPYTEDAEYALSESLGVYNSGLSYKAISEIKTKGVIDHIKSSDDDKYLAIYDESEELTLWDSNKLKKLYTYKDISGFAFDNNYFAFMGNDYFAYINNKGNIVINNIKNGKKVKEIKKGDYSYTSIRGTNNLLSYIDNKSVSIYNIKEDKALGTYKVDDSMMKEMYYSDDNKYLIASSTNKTFDINKEEYIKVHILDINSLEEINSVELNAGYISTMFTKDNNLYMLLNRTFNTEFNMVVASYNYIDGNINWTKTFDGNWGKFMTKSYPEEINDIAVVNSNKVNVIDGNTGDVKGIFDTKNEIIEIYSNLNKEIYVTFSSKGNVNFINMETNKNIEHIGKFEFNLDEYILVAKNNNGFLLVPKNDNRVISYEENSNKKIKEEKIKTGYPKDDSIKITDVKKIKKKYNVKNKNLVSNMFYSSKKDLLFVSYVNNTLGIYDTKENKHLNTIKGINESNHYYGKDKYGRMYIGDMTDAYIIDKNYKKVGHIEGLYKVKKNKVIIVQNSKYYSIPIYTLKDLLKLSKDYLK
ncbi:MAG: toll/interleukin-1 receptor domain-containing protein [Bacilli bacterium]|nr:toll/interleukin-1 receptor domain-containing protein [Bacilli bacterium]